MAVDETCGSSDGPSTAVPGIQQYCKKLSLKGVEVTYQYQVSLSSYHPVGKFNEYLEIDIIKYQLRFKRVNGEYFTSARLCSVKRLPSGLHAHGALVTTWAPIRSGPSFSPTKCASEPVACLA